MFPSIKTGSSTIKSTRSILLDHPKLDGLQIERSKILASINPAISNDPTNTTLVLSDLSSLGCLPTVLNFPVPAKMGTNTWKPGSFKGTDEDLLEIERTKKMQDLHLLDIIRREAEIEANRLKMLKPAMGLPPDSFRLQKMKNIFAREREEAQYKLQCVQEDHEAMLDAMFDDHNCEFDKRTDQQRKAAKKWLKTIVKCSLEAMHAAALNCALRALDQVIENVLVIVQEKYMTTTVRPSHREAKLYLRKICIQDHLQVWSKYRTKLIIDGIHVHQVVFPKFKNKVLKLDITVKMDIEINQLIVSAFDNSRCDHSRGPSGLSAGPRQHWTLNVPMPRTISLYLDEKQVTCHNDGSVTCKTNLQAAKLNYLNILKSLKSLVLHLLFIRNDRRQQKGVDQYQLKYDPSIATKKRIHSIFLYRQYEQRMPGCFYTNKNDHQSMKADTFRGEHFYRKDVNQVFTDRADELFSIFCEYAIRDSCISLVHSSASDAGDLKGDNFDETIGTHAGPTLEFVSFKAMLIECGLLLDNGDDVDNKDEEKKQEVAFALFQKSILNSGNKAFFIDFLETLCRWAKFTNSKIQMLVEVLIAATEVETWPKVHQRHWKDHVLFLRNTCKQNENWTNTPPETKSWIYYAHKTGVV